MAAAAWLSVAAPVAAHAELRASSPAANASLTAAPDELRLEFTEPVDAATAVVELLDVQQQTVPGLGDVVVEDDGLRIVVAAPALDEGIYVVRYQVLSTVDGHVTGGSFAFQVDPGGAAPPPAVAPTTTTPGADLPAALARWLALLGALMLVGSSLFWLVSARPALARHGIAGRRAPWGLLLVASGLALASLAAFLVIAARELPGAPGGSLPFDLAAPFGATPFATAMRMVLIAAVVATALAAWSLLTRQWGTLALLGVLGIGLAMLAGFSLAGHASALGGPFNTLWDLGHLAAVAAWLGALPAVGALFAATLRRADPEQRRGVLASALRRHGALSLVAAPMVALTGIANSPVVLGASRNLVASDYGNLVLGKGLLFAVAVGIGAANFFLVRRLAYRRLALTVGAEAMVAALAVLTAAGMLTVPAAASRAPRLVTAEVPTAHLYGSAESLSVHVIVGVPSPGSQSYQALGGAAADGTPLDDIQRVFLTFVPPPGSGLSPERITLEPATPPGLYEASGAHTPVVGEWQLELTVRRAGLSDASVAFDLPVSLPLPPEALPPVDSGIGVPPPLGFLWRFVPGPPYEWLPALGLFGAAGALWLFAPTSGGDRRRARTLAWARTGAMTLGVAAALVTGSQALVVAANAGGDGLLPTANPIAPTAESIAAGALAYEATCSGCHGATGAGDGPIAAGLSVRPSDLSTHIPFHTDAELYAFITRGISGTPMPGFATELAPDDRWNLVNYLRDRWPAP
ncbi:MAG TPA: copper resistance protein CopC [Patescibacteria group bacterium]|nr:copper resistance protein CopC [Patescibacteria group bacterium]